MKVVGLDLGSRTLGIAISDELGFLARAVETYYIKDFRGMNKILSISERNKFSKLAEEWAKNFLGG